MDKEAFANVVLSSTDSLYRISKSILKNDADCEDAVQEAIATGFGKLSTLRQETYARTGLTRILIYECYSLLKKREKTAAMLAEPQDEECASSDYSHLYDALSTLKKEYRLTIVLYYHVIQVNVSVYTAPDSRSDYSFAVESDKLGTAVKSTGNVSGLDFGQIVSYDVTVSPSVINLHLDWEVRDDSMMDILPWGEYMLEDASGKRLTRDEWMRSTACSIPEYDEAGGYNTFSQDLEIVGFDASSPTMTIIPVRVQWDADGSQIPDSQEVLEDCAVTIELTK